MTMKTLRRTAAVVAAAALALAAAVPAKADPVKPPRLSAKAITETLNDQINTPGTAWMTKPDGTVVVSYTWPGKTAPPVPSPIPPSEIIR